MSFLAYIYVDSASSTLNGIVTFGITSNASTNPSGGNSIAVINTGTYLTSTGINTMNYFPTFTFTVTTSAYYYGYMSKPVDGSLSGTYVIGARTTSLVRVG